MKDIGLLSYFLVINFEFSESTVHMHQTTYSGRILERFDMQNCSAKSMLCHSSVLKIVTEYSQLLNKGTLYQEIVGNLIYAIICTRPALFYFVWKLAQNLSKPTNANINLARIYAKVHQRHFTEGLVFCKSEHPLELIGYYDSDFANSSDRKSLSVFFSLSNNGPLISWNSKKQQIVALKVFIFT